MENWIRYILLQKNNFNILSVTFHKISYIFHVQIRWPPNFHNFLDIETLRGYDNIV